MSRLDRWRILPHEAAFAGVLLWLVARLAAASAWCGEMSLYLALVAAMACAVWWCPLAAPRWKWLVRLWLAVVVMNTVYFSLGRTVPMIHPHREDPGLQAWEERLFGGNPSLSLESLVTPALSELLSACYLLFFPMMAVAWISWSCRPPALTRLFFTGFFSTYALGFLGYALVPALGPHLDPTLAARFSLPIEGGWLTNTNRQIVLSGSNGVDVFPSLHVAISAFVLLFDFRHWRRRFWIFLGPCLGLWFSTLYLRYHYGVDLIAGLALAAGVFALLLRLEKPVSP